MWKMKIWLCSACRVLKCLWFYKMQVQRMDTVPFEALGTWKQLFVSVWQRLWECHPTGSWAIHPKSCWIKVQNTYYMTQTSCNWGNMNLIASITLSKCIFVIFHLETTLLTVVCYLEALKNKRSSRTSLGHPSSSTPPIEAEFFWKNRKYVSTLPGSSE